MRKRWTTLVAALGAAVTLAGCAGLTDAPIGEASPAEWAPEGEWSFLAKDGRLWFSSQPDIGALERFSEEGVTTIINLRTAEEMESVPFNEGFIVSRLGMDYELIPLTSRTMSVADVELLDRALRETEGPVVIHCSSGNRSGGLWAAWLARRRAVEPERAIELGKMAGLRSESMVEATARVIAAPRYEPDWGYHGDNRAIDEAQDASGE